MLPVQSITKVALWLSGQMCLDQPILKWKGKGIDASHSTYCLLFWAVFYCIITVFLRDCFDLVLQEVCNLLVLTVFIFIYWERCHWMNVIQHEQHQMTIWTKIKRWEHSLCQMLTVETNIMNSVLFSLGNYIIIIVASHWEDNETFADNLKILLIFSKFQQDCLIIAREMHRLY